jgi:uncharacterized protein YlxP (DUF503 family)
MKKQLVVSGCSVTHGSELYHPFYHENNTQGAYSALIAEQLEINSVNLAMPGVSNEYIYNSLMTYLRNNQTDDIHSVIVAWTFANRLHWHCHNRHWFFTGSWACTVENFEQSGKFQKNNNSLYCTSDQEPYINLLQSQHKFLTEHYFVDSLTMHHLNEHTQNYSMSLRSVCKEKKIKFVEIDAAKNYSIDIWRLENLGLSYIAEKRHPNHKEHRVIADYVIKNYYC